MSQPPSPVLVVGVGASAGGVEALQAFFAHVPTDSGCAYVVILHRSPEQESQLAALLQATTPIPVRSVPERVRVEPDHVYVVPPNQHLTMVDGEVRVLPNTLPEERRAPIDIFFRVLADSYDGRGVCVILSGSGSDGLLGLKLVKERGGAVFVQRPGEAAFDEMPRAAIATDLVDDVLPVADIPARIIAYRENLGAISIPEELEQRPEAQQALREVFAQLRTRTGHDFTNYKRPTLLRRIARRISVRNLPDLPAYAAFLPDHPKEVQALLKDLLISVTTFFRDPEAFAALEQEVLPRLFAGKHADDQVRVWVVGCATGEEAYSLAMLCAERSLDVLDAPNVQIFASDIDEAAIAHARTGVYSASDTAAIAPERLRRFFTQEDERYRVRSELRERVLFATHNILRDPPFAHLDLVSCRNLLIYLDRPAQERVLETLHFALEADGALFLGSAETVEHVPELFAPLNREQRLFQRRARDPRLLPLPQAGPGMADGLRRRSPPPALAALVVPADEPLREWSSYGGLHLQLLEQYAPPSLVVNEAFDLVHVSERAGRYLQISAGQPSRNLLELVRPELRGELRSALSQALQHQANVDAPALPVQIEGRPERVTLRVRPVLRPEDPARGLLLVLFEAAAAPPIPSEVVVRSDETRLQQLEEEVVRLKRQLRAAAEQYEYQAEELRATNEEQQALVEELRAASEELSTSKEELQSINEELRTVNQELKVKVEEALRSSADLQNLVNSTDIATIFLNRGMRIQLFTPAARGLFNLIAADYGRPLTDLTHQLLAVDVQAEAERVLDSLQPVEREVRTRDDRVYVLRVRPYRIGDDRIGGVVLTFFDITERKRYEERQAFLLRLGDALRSSADAEAIYAAVAHLAMEHFGTDRCYYCEIAGGTAIIRWDARRGELPSVAGTYPLDRMPIFKAIVDAGRPVVVQDAATTDVLDALLRQLCIQLEVLAFVDVPVMKNGRPVGMLCITHSTPRDWSDHDVELAVEIAERTWAAAERARAEDALRISEARHRTLFDSVDEGVCLFERLPLRPDGLRDYRYLAMNPAMQAMFGIPDLSGQSIRDNFPDEVEDWYDDYDRVLATGEPIRFARESVPQGLVLEMFVTRVEDGSGQRLLAVMQDVTARTRAEARLRASEVQLQVLYAQEQAARAEAEEASRLKDEFLATVSHELRTPLTAFLGYAQLLQLRRRDESYMTRTVAKMVQSAKTQAQLIEDLLDVSRIVSGRLRITPEPIALIPVIEAAYDTVQPTIVAKGQHLILDLDPAVDPIVGDAGRLQQLVWNLLANAAKFTPAGGSITVRLARDDQEAVLTVSDSGQGIPPDFLPFVFERFRQADNTTRRAHGGLGIGLAIVRHLVELHGGTVQAASAGVGQGATFTVRLPVLVTAPAATAADTARATDGAALDSPPELRGLRILLVDDQPELLALLEETLTPCGAVVRGCASATEALEAVRHWRPAVLVSDIAMPGEDGYWLIQQVRALAPEEGGATPAVALTAYVRMEDRLQVLTAGFQRYLPKPVEPRELWAVLAELARATAAA